MHQKSLNNLALVMNQKWVAETESLNVRVYLAEFNSLIVCLLTPEELNEIAPEKFSVFSL